jgi:hypothetical protein
VEQCKRPQTFRLSRPRPSIDNRLRYSHCHVISGPALDKDPKGQPSEDHQSMDVSPKGLPASEGVGPAQNVNRSTDLGLRLVLPSFCMVTPRKEGSNLRPWYEEGADPHTLPAVIDSRNYHLVGLRLAAIAKTAVSRPAISATCTVSCHQRPVIRVSISVFSSDACRNHTPASLHGDFQVSSTHRTAPTVPYDDTCRPYHHCDGTRGFARGADPVQSRGCFE